MSKHTPGPWQWDGPVFDYNPEEDAPWLVDVSGAIILCGEIQCQGEANARLIAAAPDLLELLVESQENIGGDWRERRDALIAKVKGQP